MRKIAALTAVNLVLALLLMGPCLGFDLPMDIGFALTAGWVLYLSRVMPQISLNWNGVFTAVVCLAALAVGLQWLFGWFYKQVQRQRGNPTARKWSLRWTVRVVGLVVLMFVAGISAIGITHQTGWLITSPEPLTEGGISVVGHRIESANNLKQIGLACHNYHEQHAAFPPGGTFDAHGGMMHGWQTLLLPFMEESALYQRISLEKPWKHPDNAPAFQVKIRRYLHPGIREQEDQDSFALSHYAGNVRVLGGDVPRSFKDITDGLSNTVLAGEAAGNYKPWGYPANWRDPALGLNKSPDGFGGPSPAGTNFLFADGSIHNIKNDIDPTVLKALSTPNGGEIITNTDDW